MRPKSTHTSAFFRSFLSLLDDWSHQKQKQKKQQQWKLVKMEHWLHCSIVGPHYQKILLPTSHQRQQQQQLTGNTIDDISTVLECILRRGKALLAFTFERALSHVTKVYLRWGIFDVEARDEGRRDNNRLAWCSLARKVIAVQQNDPS